MLFNSLDFVFFLAFVLVGHALLRERWRADKVWLVLASYAFYMEWSPPFGLLLLGSSLLDFGIGRRLASTEAPGARRLLVILSACGNLGVLGFFKYGQFITESVRAAWGLPPLPPDSLLANVVLPVGISFYTFQTMSYSIDVYRRVQEPCEDLLDFMLYVAFFPQLVAGPIVRAGDFLPQLRARPPVDGPLVEDALSRIGMGAFKKIVLADTLGALVDQVFAAPGAMPRGNVLLAVYGYAFQIYFDFSGYTDIAIGVAQLFGIRLPENFNRPYLAASPREFWHRWHMSLSTWLRDYLYIPLGGNRHGRPRALGAMLVTMLLGGLWHGAAWTFVVWGAYHGIVLAGDRLVRWWVPVPDRPFVRVLGRVATFHLVCLGWVVFRAASLPQVREVLAGLGRPGFDLSTQALGALLALTLAIIAHGLWSASRLRRWHVAWPPWLQGVGYVVLVVLIFLFAPGGERFIYFQF